MKQIARPPPDVAVLWPLDSSGRSIDDEPRRHLPARQHFGSGGTANQLPDLERLCATRGWTITHRYVETISGTAKVRPEAGEDAGRRAPRRGTFKAVVVWALDRLGRAPH